MALKQNKYNIRHWWRKGEGKLPFVFPCLFRYSHVGLMLSSGEEMLLLETGDILKVDAGYLVCKSRAIEIRSQALVWGSIDLWEPVRQSNGTVVVTGLCILHLQSFPKMVVGDEADFLFKNF